MRALCAASVSELSLGMENASIDWLSWPALVSCTTATLVILVPSRVTLTCIGPCMVASPAPVMVRVPVDIMPEPALLVAFFFAGEAVAVAFGLADLVMGAAGVAAATLDALGLTAGSATSAADVWVLNDSSAASPAAVPPMVKMARRM